MEFILCPECGAENKLEAVNCESCSADLSAVKSLVDTANEHYNEALALAHSGKLDEAIGQIEAALSMNAQNPQYHNLLGTLNAQKGLFSESIRAWERCLALDPEMERAYLNIEKAHDMEEEYAEEQTRRPFLLATIGSGIAAVILFVLSGYLGILLYFSSGTVDRLQDQLTSVNQESADFQSQLKAFQTLLPEGGVSGLLLEMQSLKTQISEKEKQIEEIQSQHELVLGRRQEATNRLTTQYQEARNQIREKDTELQQLNSLQTVIATNNNKLNAMEKELEETNKTLELEQERVADLRDKLKLAQETSNNIREDKETALNNLKASHEKMIEKEREENHALLVEVGKLERKIEDIKYASNLIVEALKNIDANQYDLAITNAQNALNRAPELSAANYVHNEVKGILTDPLEKVRRYEAALKAKENKAKQSLAFANDYINRAESSLKSGSFDEAIVQAQLAVDLGTNESVKKEGTDIIKLAEEKKVQLMTIINDAKHFIQEQNLSKAESELKKALKMSPSNAEAKKLLEQVTANAS